MLCLDGVNSVDLQSVLDYVYFGQVRILQENLDRFLSVAQKLKLEGLMGDGNDNESENEQIEQSSFKTEEVPNMEGETPNSYTNLKRNANQRRQSRTNESKVIVPLKWTLDSSQQINKEKVDENITRNTDGTKTCKICGKTSKPSTNINNMRKHVETHLDGLAYTCNFCEKTLRSYNSLNSHISQTHKNQF